jgi:hypothetical protein
MLTQEGHTNSILEHGQQQASRHTTSPHARLGKADSTGLAIPADKEWLLSVVGSSMNSTCTCPDLTFSAGSLAKFMDEPCEHHITAAKRVLRYINIIYSGLGKDTDTLVGFSNADYAEDPDTRKSTTGLCVAMNGAAIIWTLKRQSTVASSTAEAEYTALFSATQEVMFLSQLLSDLGIEMGPTTILEDNQPAIHIANNPVTSSHSKHFDVRLHYTCEKVLPAPKLRDGIISFIHTDAPHSHEQDDQAGRTKLKASALGVDCSP